MSLRSWARLTGALAILLSACGPTAAPAPTGTPTSAPIVPSTLSPATATPTPFVLSVWVPPAFAPDPQTAAGTLLADRLAEFEARHPEVRLEVRTKTTSGPAGLLETLRVSSQVAPAAVPDLIALDPSSLATAAEEGLIGAYPGPRPLPEEADWFSFALEPTVVQDVAYGVPVASRMDVLAYDAARYARPPADWSAILGGPAPFLFPAADPTGRFSISQYLALEGSLQQDDGSPGIDPAVLESVLTFYGSAYNAGVLPLTSRQYENASQTWKAFTEGRAASAVTPLESWMANPTLSAAVPLPTRESGGAGLTTTWSWAVVARNGQRQAVVVELVEWLSDPFFLGPWTYAMGMLPPNRLALDAWPAGPATALANQLVRVARAAPSSEILGVVGPSFQVAVDAVLSGEKSPQEAALAAATEVGGR